MDEEDPHRRPKDWSVVGLTLVLGVGFVALVLVVVGVWLLLGPVWWGVE